MSLREELIASIQNERRDFDMSQYHRGNVDRETANCRTAMCMAGHIEALRPKLAKKFAAELGNDGLAHEHKHIAAKIWEHEMGTPCRLDFLGDMHVDSEGYASRDFLQTLTREDAISHIKGRSKRWPLLPKKEVA